MDVFGQIRHFRSLFIQYASWNPSNNVRYLKHNNIRYILEKLWMGLSRSYLFTLDNVKPSQWAKRRRYNVETTSDVSRNDVVKMLKMQIVLASIARRCYNVIKRRWRKINRDSTLKQRQIYNVDATSSKQCWNNVEFWLPVDVEK